MIRMEFSELAKIVHGELFGAGKLLEDAEFHFDSRQVKPGDVFLALQGESADGHEYISDALANGAVLAIVNKSVAGPHIIVKDVMHAIAILANHVRKQLTALKVIGITGSQGKTTTKDMLNSILQRSGETVAARGSFNNDLGVPLTLLRATPKTKYCIVEMGARHGGDILTLTKIAVPDVGAVLKVGNAHLGEFGSREKIAATKGELIAGLQPGATAILGTYDEFTPQMRFAVGVKKLTFGERSDCDVRAADIELRGGYAHFDLVTPDGREPVELRVLGVHQVPNALAAAAIAYSLEISTANIAVALSLHESASKWRMELKEISEVLLINDSYNANPESMAAAVQTLVLLTQEKGGRSWAFLATMHELGDETTQLHEAIGKLCGELGIDHLVSIGNKDYLAGLASSATESHYFEKVEDTFSLIPRLEPGDVVLVKASRAEHLEVLAERIELELSARGVEEKLAQEESSGEE